MFSERIEQWAKDYESKGRLAGLNEGRQEGRCTEAASTLLRQMIRRFGTVSETAKSRIEQANLEALELWLDRIIDAKTAEDVFDPTASNGVSH